jgi:phosphatidylserine/phosphatidylglycerophosphate/cardiolipin synthase-like enzyme
MTKILFLILSFILISCSLTTDKRKVASDGNSDNIEVYMSPTQGKEAFEKMYDMIKEAEESVNVTVYSWSDSGFTKALRATLLKENPPTVRVVMKKSLFVKQKKTIEELEKLGAMFKSAKVELHEKFILADGKKLVNSSANMSGGAKNKYSENFIFFDNDGERNSSDITTIIKEFEKEFAIIWNSAHDFITDGEIQSADVLNHKKTLRKRKRLRNIKLYSSSMNYTITAPRKRDFDKGSVIGLKRKPNKKNQIWTVKDQIIKAINEAKTNIFLNINHFNLKEISDALIEAVKRGVDVKLAVDSQEFKMFLNNREMTPQFVKDFVKLKGKEAEIPVRVKFYSFVPHHSSWSLNHHKSILIDYDPSGSSDTLLLTGSYNYSKTAEHSKFDNQVRIKGDAYQKVHDAFYDEFMYLWNLERNSQDQPKKKNLDFFKVAKKNLIPLHSNIPFSLSWKEAVRLNNEIFKLHPESKFFYKSKQCQYFNTKSKIYLKRDRKTVCTKKR